MASAVALALAGSCYAAELKIPASVERDRPITVIYRTGLQATGKGQLHVEWTDVLGRVVEDRSIAIELTDENEIRFPLDVTRAVAMQNTVTVHFTFDGLNKKGEKDHREETATVSFIATPPDRTWWDYQIIMWQGGTAEHFKKLEEVGVNAGKSNEHSMELPEFLLKNDLRWYVENMATDFYSAYHIYRPDRPYNFELLNQRKRYKEDPSSKESLKRHPSFLDPAWLSKIQQRLTEATRIYAPYRPIFYNLADESGIAELAGFSDFDFSDYSLDGMRAWLQNRYGTLAALNAQWQSNFTDWDLVTPDTTREAMKRTDENYSSWADHKEWMDISFANALRAGADAVRAVDPQAYVGIEGAQMPGWGGYDYARLSNTVQAMEPYDIGDNIEIVRSLNPGLAFVTTAFATGLPEKQRVWYELLHGARGQIIWDEKNDVVKPDGEIGPRGSEVAPYWNELRDGVGALLINSVRQAGPIAIHYSQASMRTEWMREQRPKGDAWVDRLSSTERKDSDFLNVRDSYCRLIEDQGLQYNFVAYGQVEDGELLKRGYRVLVLPRSSALSVQEAHAIAEFVQLGGVLVVDGDAGTFDEHSRRLPKSSLSELLDGAVGRGKVMRLNAIDYHQQRVLGTETALRDAMGAILRQAGVRPAFAVVDSQGRPVTGIETHEFRNGATTIIGLLSNPQIDIAELGPPELRSNQRFEKPQTVRLVLPGELYGYDIRRGKNLGKVKVLTLTVDPYEPALLAFTAEAMPALRVSAPARLARGETGRVSLRFDGPSPAGMHVFHVNVRNPAGETVGCYSGNVLAPSGSTEHALPLARNDAAGRWTVRAKDLLSGQEQTVSFDVF